MALSSSVHHLVSDSVVWLGVAASSCHGCLPRHGPAQAPHDKRQALPRNLPREEQAAAVKEMLELLQFPLLLLRPLPQLLLLRLGTEKKEKATVKRQRWLYSGFSSRSAPEQCRRHLDPLHLQGTQSVAGLHTRREGNGLTISDHSGYTLTQ